MKRGAAVCRPFEKFLEFSVTFYVLSVSYRARGKERAARGQISLYEVSYG